MLSKMATPATQAPRFRYGKSRRTVAVMCVPDKEISTISEKIAKMEVAMGCKIKIKGFCTVKGKQKKSNMNLSDATDKSEARREKSNNDDNEDVVRFSGVPFEAETCATEQFTVGGDKKSSLRFVQVGRDIGYGKSSRVYLGIDAESLETVAVKEVCLARKTNKAKVEAELQVLQLHVNPNVDAASKHLVKYFGTATSPHRDTYSFVVEHMMNGSLRTWMDRAIEEDTSLPMEWIASLSKDIMLGLDHLHSRLASKFVTRQMFLSKHVSLMLSLKSTHL
jgi:serine/threonine protein kinase